MSIRVDTVAFLGSFVGVSPGRVWIRRLCGEVDFAYIVIL